MVVKEGRQRIERAALELFATRGIENASTRDIAQHAGVAEGTLYRHFRTKDELAASLFFSCAARLVRSLEQSLSGRPTTPEKLRAIIDAFFDYAHDDPLGYAYVMHHHPPLDSLPKGTRLPKDVVSETLREIPNGPYEPMLGTALLVGMIVRTLFFLRQGFLKDSPESVRAHLERAARKIFEEKP